MRASVIVVTHAGVARLGDGLASLAPYSGRDDIEVILVDNGSSDGCGEVTRREYPWVRTVRSERNLGFTGGVRLGAESAEGEVLVFLNDDASAEPGLVESHLETLAAHPAAAATGGRLVSWDRGRHDFLRGRVTFDVHGFQIGQGFPVGEIDPPEPGEPLPFACGGNMAVRRRDWDGAGGFDPELFAYFEDVEFGWRLWAMGREVIAAPDAVARHRGSATSSAMGDFRRGVLFERNALRIFHSCADADHRQALGGVVYATFLHRMVDYASSRPDWSVHVADPFGSTIDPPDGWSRWTRRLREQGPVDVLRHAAARLLLGRVAGQPRIEDGHLLMQLRAAHGYFEGIAATDRRRRELERLRTVSDREILQRFPRLVVPTYSGDKQWFETDAFRSLLPEDWPLEFVRLEDILHPDLLE